MRSPPSAAWWAPPCRTRPNPGTIRGDLGISGLRNLIHASDAAETARDELALWFGEGDLLDYEREVDAWIVAEEPPRQ